MWRSNGQSQVLVLTFSPYMVTRIQTCAYTASALLSDFFFSSLFLKQGLYVAQASLRNTSQPFFLQVPGYWDCRLAPSRFHILIKKVWSKLLKLFQIFASSTKIQNKLDVLVQILKNLKWEEHHPVLLCDTLSKEEGRRLSLRLFPNAMLNR